MKSQNIKRLDVLNNNSISTLCRHPKFNAGAARTLESRRLLNAERFRIKYGMTLFTNNAAFTLIELLVVVLIIGILAAVALPQYQKAVLKSRYVQAKVMTKSIADAEEVYYMAKGEYTLDPEALSISLPNTTGCQQSGNYMVCTMAWGTCSLATHAVNCNVFKNGSRYMEFNWWLDNSSNPKIKSCVVYNTNLNDVGNQICKSETKRSSPQDFTSYLSWEY